MTTCSLCGDSVDSVAHLAEEVTLKLIQQMNPQWASGEGICRKCLEYYHNLDKKVVLLPESST